MRALAEFVMRGRVQAIGIAVAGVLTLLFAWVSAAVVALVVLRRGLGEGLFVLGWTLLAALAVALWGGDIGPATALIGAVVAAQVLRSAVSWPYALVTAVGVGLVTALLLQLFGGSYVEGLLALVGDFLEQLNTQLPADEAGRVAAPVASQVTGLLGFSATGSTVVALLLARWWQGQLYNPGGFREEFHRLRLPVGVSALLLIGALLVASIGPEWRLWALMFAVPFVVAGFALVHGLAGRRGWGRGALVLFYLAWLIVDWVKLALMVAALLDSGLNFRDRGRQPADRS